MDRSMLARATESTDAPTPGYLYVDLAKAASANPMACQEMATYLANRLQSKNNPNVKYKCCKVIAKLCETVPRNQFRRCIAQNASAVSAIKEALNYRGTMDPVRGDEPNQKVRIAAKEALDAVYSESPSSEQYTPAGSISSSYGSTPHAGSYGGAPAVGRRMEGVGNPMFTDPRMDPRYNGTQPSNIREAIKEAGDVIVGMIKDPLAKNVPMGPPPPRQGHSGDLPGLNRSHYGRPPPGASELSRRTGGEWTMASNRGPGAIQQSEYYKSRDTSFQWAQREAGSAPTASGTVGGSWGSVSSTILPGQNHSTPRITINSLPSSGHTGGASSDGTYERNLIMELCPPSGLKPVPPADKLASFASSVPSLNSELICPIVLDCLEEGQPWIIRAKALCVMETCIQSGTRSDGSNPYRDFFYACADEFAPLAAHPRAAIKEPAFRVLKLLGVAAPEGAVHVAQAAPPVAAPQNLLDFDDNDRPPAPVPSQPPPPPPPAEVPPAPPVPSSGNMFGGMQVKGTPAVAGVAAAPSAAAPAPAPQTEGDLLGDFTSSLAAPLSTASADIFTTANVNQPQPPADMFSQMSIKSEEIQPQSSGQITEAAPALSLGGSAFSFINETTGAADTAINTKTTPSFDPLKNSTPQTTQRKMMQMSPEQMQAMAYQQNMWLQQQQQMQQMQMAMAMMQRGGGVPQAMVMPPMYPTLNHQHVGAPRQPGFTFMGDARPAKKDDKKFDFVKDAMQTAGHKK